MTPRIAAVIPSLRGSLEHLERLVNELALAGASTVVAPTSRALEVSLQGTRIPFVHIGANPGFGSTVTRAAAQCGDWEWLMVVNDDMSLDGQILARFVTGFTERQRPAVAYLDPVVRKPIPGLWATLGQLSLVGSRLRGPGASATASPRGSFRPFSLALISRDLWEALQGMDSNLLYTFEDADFARRADLLSAEAAFPCLGGIDHATSSTSRRHVDTVLPVAAWSAAEYLTKWSCPRPVARALCSAALVARFAAVPVAHVDRRSHVIGIARAIRALVSGRRPDLVKYEIATI